MISYKIILISIYTFILSSQLTGIDTLINKPYEEILLTYEEKEFLSNKRTFTMVVDPNWKPFDYIDKNKHSGMGADYMKLISERLGINIKIIPTNSWAESLSIAKDGGCDIISMLNKTPDRSKYLDFTDPFFTSQIIIISKERVWLTKGLNELSGKKVAVGEGYWLEENIRKDFPNINLITKVSPEDTLRMVAEGDAFATVVTLIEAMLIIRQEAFSDLRIIGQTNYENKLRLGVPKDNELLLQILQKSVLSLSEEENNAIFSKWASIKIEEPFNYFLLWKISGLVFFILTIFLIWNRKLSKFNNSLKKLHKELAIKNDTLKRLSITDKLTGLYNRMKLDSTLRNEIFRTRRYKKPLSIIIMDIDNFKSINDRFGHQTGDSVLKCTAKVLSQNVREVDIVGRWGGEEFLFICPNTNINGAFTLADNLRLKIENQVINNNISYTASFGVAQFMYEDDEQSILYNADQALYDAKKNGRNRVEIKKH